MKRFDKYGLCLEEYTNNNNNAKVYYNRAVGKFPEMEVSKAMAKIIKKYIKKDERVLDVGCATGHFYRSLKREIKESFYYTGCDPYKIFLNFAIKAWKNDKKVSFKKGNIYNLPFKKILLIFVFQAMYCFICRHIKANKELLRVTKRD